jgi:hypothetical protein
MLDPDNCVALGVAAAADLPGQKRNRDAASRRLVGRRFVAIAAIELVSLAPACSLDVVPLSLSLPFVP